MAEPVAGGPRGERRFVPWLTLGCALALLVVFALQLAYPAPTAQARLILLGADSPGLVRDGEWFRLATASLLHASLLHLAINSIALMVLVAYLEGVIGRLRLATVLLASAFAGALAAGLVLAEIALPHQAAVDSMAHLGGLAGGLLATGLLLRGADTARLPARPGPVGLAVLTALALAFGLGVGEAARRVVSGDRSALFRQAEFALAQPDADPGELNNLVYLLAVQPDVSLALLRSARERIRAALVERPDAHEFLDTLAVVYYRLADYDAAIEAARAALGAAGSAGYATRLVWLEAARAERLGTLRLGAGSDLEVELVQRDVTLELRFEPASQRPTTVHVLLREAGRLRGIIDLHLEPGVGSARVELSPVQGAQRSFALALVDTRPAGKELALRLLAYDPALVPALPPPVAEAAPL